MSQFQNVEDIVETIQRLRTDSGIVVKMVLISGAWMNEYRRYMCGNAHLIFVGGEKPHASLLGAEMRYVADFDQTKIGAILVTDEGWLSTIMYDVLPDWGEE